MSEKIELKVGGLIPNSSFPQTGVVRSDLGRALTWEVIATGIRPENEEDARLLKRIIIIDHQRQHKDLFMVMSGENLGQDLPGYEVDLNLYYVLKVVGVLLEKAPKEIESLGTISVTTT